MKKIISGTMDITKHNEVSIVERDIKFTIVVGDIHFKALDTSKIRESIQGIYYPNKRVDIFPKIETILDI